MTSIRVDVRRAVPGDEATLRALRLQALTDDPDAFGSTYERELARTTADWQRWLAPGVTFIVNHGDEARGLVAGAHDANDRAIVQLMAMWVHPALRGTGAAAALVAALLAWAAAQGGRDVRLLVIARNDRARRFYERHGFTATGRQLLRERDGATEIEMQCPVTRG